MFNKLKPIDYLVVGVEVVITAAVSALFSLWTRNEDKKEIDDVVNQRLTELGLVAEPVETE